MLRPEGDAAHVEGKLVAHYHAGPLGATTAFGPRTVATPKPREAMGQHSTRKELAKVLLDEAGQAVAVAAVRDFLEEGLQVLADDGSARGEGRQCPEMDTRDRGSHGPPLSGARHYGAGRRLHALVAPR